MRTAFAVVWVLLALGVLAGRVGLLAAGHPSCAIPPLIVPVVMLAFFAGFNVIGLRSLKQAIPRLVDEVSKVLDSSLVMPTAVIGQEHPAVGA